MADNPASVPAPRPGRRPISRDHREPPIAMATGRVTIQTRIEHRHCRGHRVDIFTTLGFCSLDDDDDDAAPLAQPPGMQTGSSSVELPLAGTETTAVVMVGVALLCLLLELVEEGSAFRLDLEFRLTAGTWCIPGSFSSSWHGSDDDLAAFCGEKMSTWWRHWRWFYDGTSGTRNMQTG
ncbi:hypothetical protein LSH36_412g01016 [Paralvinella palmiformis]|uniref:Uncharacterized protein n=1 Tax=Paralvinella palmiformis TaxID=53620 RepID=A0AAD9JC85_9ANNE|nr:hypothetical protein LSH36_412g01016 [Paralvinella palmiformis]